jgi:hypothetical protein
MYREYIHLPYAAKIKSIRQVSKNNLGARLPTFEFDLECFCVTWAALLTSLTLLLWRLNDLIHETSNP